MTFHISRIRSTSLTMVIMTLLNCTESTSSTPTLLSDKSLISTTESWMMNTCRMTSSAGYQTEKKYPGTLRKTVYFAPEL